MNFTLSTGLEKAFQTYLSGSVTGSLANRVYRYINPVKVTTPCVFVMAGKGSVKGSQSGEIYKVPLKVVVVYMAQDEKDNPSTIDNLTTNVELVLTGSLASINSASNDVFLFDLYKDGNPYLDCVDNTYQYNIDLNVVAKNK